MPLQVAVIDEVVQPPTTSAAAAAAVTTRSKRKTTPEVGFSLLARMQLACESYLPEFIFR